ncbi:MAG: C4-type zinc ribbon domain-containing protein [Spirochaetaceae bacterium]|jgi:predicted  nucleic acid-binding Zn-ribbon protein|nr:C4-type zinc ribbon domain-containing protein [Spirochaetaceae bacterium]
MEKTFETLQKLQEILSEKYSIERDILEIPKALETKQEILNRLKKSYVEKNQEFESTKGEIRHLNFEMTEAERLREEFEKRMDVITTQREYEALDKEIRDATEKEQRFRRDIQKRERDLEEMRSALEREEQMIKMQEDELKAENEKIKAETSEKETLLASLAKEESKITPGMDDGILFKFQRIIRNKSGVGIVPVKANVCSGCHMVLPAQFVNDVRGGEEIQFCPYCSRILFWEEGGEPVAEAYEFDDEDVGGLADLVNSDAEL